MKKTVRPIVYKLLLEYPELRGKDNLLIAKTMETIEGKADIHNTKLCLEGITRARRKFFEEYPELKPQEVTKARIKEETEYISEYRKEI